MHSKMKFIADLDDKEQISEIFLVKMITMQMGKNGKNYLNLILCDKSGEIEARMWDKVEPIFESVKKNSFIKAEGKINPYQGRKQFVIFSCTSVEESTVDLGDFVAVSSFNIEKMVDELKSMISKIQDTQIKALANTIIEDSRMLEGFKYAPAAKGVHHAYAGGLLEHVLSVGKLTESFANHYSGVNKDLAIFGAVFHDIGKVLEFEFGKATDYSDEGRLVGHIVIGCEIISDYAKKVPGGISDEKLWQIKHILLSHHGELEFGSPKRPKTLEALLVSKADDIDSKMNAIQGFIMKDESQNNWTQYHKMYDRFFFKGESNESYSPKILETNETHIDENVNETPDVMSNLKKHFSNVGK